MSAPDGFIDTNVLIYLLSEEAEKADRAEDLLASGGIVSVQVLNEFASIAARKLRMTIPEIREILTAIRAVCEVCPVDIDVHEGGLAISERFGFSIYDSLLLAAAERAGCRTFYSEDLQDGQRVGGLLIRNPFRPD